MASRLHSPPAQRNDMGGQLLHRMKGARNLRALELRRGSCYSSPLHEFLIFLLHKWVGHALPPLKDTCRPAARTLTKQMSPAVWLNQIPSTENQLGFDVCEIPLFLLFSQDLNVDKIHTQFFWNTVFFRWTQSQTRHHLSRYIVCSHVCLIEKVENGRYIWDKDLGISGSLIPSVPAHSTLLRQYCARIQAHFESSHGGKIVGCHGVQQTRKR